MLEFVRVTTDIIIRTNNPPKDSYLSGTHRTPSFTQKSSSAKYKLNAPYSSSYETLGHPLDKLIGCYGPPLMQLHQSLRSPSLGRDLCSETHLTKAFDINGGSKFYVSIINTFVSSPVYLCDLVHTASLTSDLYTSGMRSSNVID
jgi:hypothetical protein